jgi:hypothetical protein
VNGRTATQAYQAERDRIAMTGDLEPTYNPVIGLPDPDEPDASILYRLMALRVREMYVSPMHRERAIGEAKAQKLAAIEADCWEWLEDVGHPKDPDVPKVDRYKWDDETDWKEGRWWT